VIHVGRVRKLRDYAQESGRAGRDGLKSEAIILQGVSYNRRGEMIKEDTSSWMEKDMDEFVMTERCRRIVLDRVMDGRESRVGCEEDEEKCDNCRGYEWLDGGGGGGGGGEEEEDGEDNDDDDDDNDDDDDDDDNKAKEQGQKESEAAYDTERMKRCIRR